MGRNLYTLPTVRELFTSTEAWKKYMDCMVNATGKILTWKRSDAFMKRRNFYLSNKYAPPDVQEIRKLAHELGDVSPFVFASVNIPVAGHQEGKNIYRALKSYSHQDGLRKYNNWNAFEINLFINSPEPSEESPYDWTETIEEIERFKRDHPHMIINVIKVRLGEDSLDIGIIRGLLTDACIARHGIHDNHVIISNDADQVSLNPFYIANTIRTVTKNDVNIVGGMIDYDNVTYANYPEYLVTSRFAYFLHGAYGTTPGANTAYKAGRYIQVGGYKRSNGVGEDNALGRSILTIGHDLKNKGYRFGKGTKRVVSDGRRVVDHLLRSGEIPKHGIWSEKFHHDDAYRALEKKLDTSYLEKILSDDLTWSDFLDGLMPKLLDIIGLNAESLENLRVLLDKNGILIRGSEKREERSEKIPDLNIIHLFRVLRKYLKNEEVKYLWIKEIFYTFRWLMKLFPPLGIVPGCF